MTKVVIGLFIASYVIVLCITFLLITIYIYVHNVILSRFVFLSQLFKWCAGVPYQFFNEICDSLGLSTVINTRYLFFYFSLYPLRFISRTCENPRPISCLSIRDIMDLAQKSERVACDNTISVTEFDPNR